MNKLGDVVFCVDCDRERQAHLEIAEAAEAAEAAKDVEAIDVKAMDVEAVSPSPEQDKHPRRMATKKDANGDPLCSQCLDDRQAKRRAEFMLSDDRRTVVHWPRPGRASDPKPALLSSTDSAADPSASSRVGSLGVAVTKAANGSRSRLAGPPRQDPTKNKAAFVRSLPPGTPARDVIAQAKKQGLEITPAYVYVIRSTDGARKQSRGAEAAREIRSKSNGRALNGRELNGRQLNGRQLNGRPLNGGPLHGQVLNNRVLDIRALRIPKPKDRGIERKFMWLAVELGFLRTEQLLDELRTKIKVVFTH